MANQDSAAQVVGTIIGLALVAVSLPFAITAYPDSPPSSVLWAVAWEAGPIGPDVSEPIALGTPTDLAIAAQEVAVATVTVAIECTDQPGVPAAPAATLTVTLTLARDGETTELGRIAGASCADARKGLSVTVTERPDLGRCSTQEDEGCVRAGNETNAQQAVLDRLGDSVGDVTIAVHVEAQRAAPPAVQVQPASFSGKVTLGATAWSGTALRPATPPQEVLR